jgi:hypothetical protein
VSDTEADDPRFPVEDSIVGIDERNGDVFVYSGEGAASYAHGKWWPGIWFNKASMLDYTDVRDPAKIREYLNAARSALAQSLEGD